MNFSEIMCYMNKLKVKQTQLEKSELDSIRMFEKYGYPHQELYNKLKQTRDQESDEIRIEVFENLQFLKFIKNQLIGDSLIKCDLQKLRHEMCTMQNFTQCLKNRIETELDDLNKEELALTLHVTNTEMKVSGDLDKKESLIENTSINANRIQKERQVLKEVKDFLTFLDNTGGHDGGWPQDDHLLFLKLSQKLRKKQQLFEALLKIFPDKTEAQISAHIEWFQTYSDLKINQKLAIQHWKEEKSQKQNNAKLISREEEKPPNIKAAKINTTNVKQVKQKIKNWKLEQQQKMEHEAKMRMEEMKKAIENEEMKKLKQRKTKEEVEKWKSMKEAKDKAEKLTQEILYLREKEKRMLMANKLIRDFQNQDNIIISKRLNQLKINIDPPNINPLPSERKKYPRNPNRVSRPTKNWEARQAATEENLKKFSAQIAVMKIPKLARPTWRKTAEVK